MTFKSTLCIIKIQIIDEVDEMLTKNTQMNRDQIEMIALEQLVPANHLVGRLKQL